MCNNLCEGWVSVDNSPPLVLAKHVQRAYVDSSISLY